MEPKVAEDEAEIGTDRDKRAQRKAALDMEKVAIAADEKRLRLLKGDEAERRELAREEAEVALRRARVKLEMDGLQQQEQSAREQSEREIAASVAALEAMQRIEIMANLETHLEDIRRVYARAFRYRCSLRRRAFRIILRSSRQHSAMPRFPLPFH